MKQNWNAHYCTLSPHKHGLEMALCTAQGVGVRSTSMQYELLRCLLNGAAATLLLKYSKQCSV
jgi:hypothetical protein